jgi:hypothetical protein
VSDFADFLLARIAEDEGRVRDADSDGEYRIAWLTYRNPDGSMRYTALASDRRDGDWHVTGMHDPRNPASVSIVLDARRVLAECDAKRRIAELHFPRSSNPNICNEDEDVLPCETQRLLALPYADHPDYRREWRP